MRNFNDFLNEEAEGDKKEKESWKLYYSDKFFEILKKIGSNNVAKELLSNETKIVSNLSWIDIDENDSKNLSYLSLDRAKRVEAGNINSNPSIDSPLWTSPLRQTMLVGKLINKLFPNKFTNLDIDEFYNRYRPEIDTKKTKGERFKLVKGEDIRKWYNSNMYNGEMGSCMRHDKCSSFFNIYVENPEKCGLLLYLDETGDRAYGRALVWFGLFKPSGDTKDESYTLMDRVYTVNGQPQLTSLFKKYAIDNKWMYKEGDGFMFDGQRKTTSVTIRLKPKDYGKYPYCDTMVYFTPATGRASSSPGNPGRDPNDPTKIFSRYNLRSQEGGYSKMD